MSDIAQRVAKETFDSLVRQFSDEMAFLRELVQNALDASSAEVDVAATFDGARGLATVAVTDYGEGMTREIIDSKLTRLFASSKEDDFTKIGKFGIGFVSVFAIGPEAVVVDTGRSGESWRILFKPGGTFERIRLAQPVEGTVVTVYKSMTQPAFDRLQSDARATLRYWCRHAQAVIRFNGEAVNEPFDVACAVKGRYVDGFNEVVAGLSAEEKPFFGFYNAGLTLMEGYEAIVPGVTFKIKSKYLEHTLTRDNVKKDANYEKAMKALRKLVDTDLRKALFDDLAAAGDAAAYHQRLAARAPYLAKRWREWGRDAAVVRTLHGERALSLADLEKTSAALRQLLGKYRRKVTQPLLLFEEGPTPVTEALQRQGIPVLATQTVSSLRGAFESLGFRPTRASELFSTPVAVGPAPARLLDATCRLLGECGIKLAGTEAVKLEGGGNQASQVAVVVQHLDNGLVVGGQSALDEDERPPRWPLSLRSRGRLLANLEHPLVGVLSELAAVDVDAAAYALAKAACLADGIHPHMEDRLLAAHASSPPQNEEVERAQTAAVAAAPAVEACLRAVMADVEIDERLDPRVEVAPMGHDPLVAFKGMRVRLNGDHPYLRRATWTDGHTFRLASAVFTSFNVALDKVVDAHEMDFLQALTGWLLERRS